MISVTEIWFRLWVIIYDQKLLQSVTDISLEVSSIRFTPSLFNFFERLIYFQRMLKVFKSSFWLLYRLYTMFNIRGFPPFSNCKNCRMFTFLIVSNNWYCFISCRFNSNDSPSDAHRSINYNWVHNYYAQIGIMFIPTNSSLSIGMSVRLYLEYKLFVCVSEWQQKPLWIFNFQIRLCCRSRKCVIN